MKKFELTMESTRQDYLDLEKELVNDFRPQIYMAAVTTKTNALGYVKTVEGNTFNKLFLTIDFGTECKKYDMSVALTNKFLTFKNPELLTTYNTYFKIHEDLTAQEVQLDKARVIAEATKKAEQEAARKAEAQYQKAKDRALKTFEEQINRDKDTTNKSANYFFALGWLAKHIGTISAKIPDYLDAAFQKYFGADAVHTTIDSKKKTVNGFAMQWSWSFKASLIKASNIPAALNAYLNEQEDAITNTSFIWDLIDTWGFQFGRKQDVNKILANVPADCVEAFNAGFIA